MTTIFAFDTATSVATCSLARAGEPVGEARTEARLVLHQEGRSALVPGDEVTFGVRVDGLRYFSADDGAALASRGVAAP